MRTIQEIQQEFGSKSAGILNAYHDVLDEIKAQREPEAVGYLDRLSGAQRMGLLREQAMERSGEATRQAREDYLAEVESYHEELSRRVENLRSRLFKAEDAGALSRAALASDAELGTLMALAAQAGNAELGRAAFVAAEQRGLGDVMAAFFDKVDPEARGLYGEWREIPPPEMLTRQRESVETLLPGPTLDELKPWAAAMR